MTLEGVSELPGAFFQKFEKEQVSPRTRRYTKRTKARFFVSLAFLGVLGAEFCFFTR